MTEYVRRCPNCGSARPLSEYFCEGDKDGSPCHWPLLDVLPTSAPDAVVPQTAPASGATPKLPKEDSGPKCREGHTLADGDLLCEICGEGPADERITEVEAPRLSLLASG